MIPYVSICIPTYCKDEAARERLIRCIRSVRAALPIEEIIVCDDASPYEIRPLEAKVVRHEENKGPYAAMVTAVSHSDHEVILILDDDVVIPIGFGRVLGYLLTAMPNVGAMSWKSAKEPVTGLIRQFIDPATELASYCMVTRRIVWDELGGLDLRFKYYCADSDYCLRAALAGYPCYRVHAPLVFHEEHATLNETVMPGISASPDLMKFSEKWGGRTGKEMETVALSRFR